jgi:hypothetical protein
VNLEVQIILQQFQVRFERMRLLVKELVEQRRQQSMAVNLPYLQGVGSALDKLRSAIEDDAKDFIEKRVAAVDQKRKAILGKGGKADIKLSSHDAALSEIDTYLDELDNSLRNNGTPLPTSDDSSGSSDK